MSIRLFNTQLSVEIAPLGAELQSITTADGHDWLWNGDAAFWSGRSPVLFPIVGKAPGDMVGIEGHGYPMNQHGFARRSTFTLETASDDFCRFVLTADEGTRAVYPFAFRLAMEYRLTGKAVSVTAEVTNEDTRPLPFGLGFHPAFVYALPGATPEDHRVQLDNKAEPALIRIDGGLLKPEPLPSPFTAGNWPVEHSAFAADAMVFPEGAGTALRYGVPGGPELAFSWQNLPNFALWSKPGAGFICLEPWHGTAPYVGSSNAITDRPGTIELEPGGQQRFGFTVEILA